MAFNIKTFGKLSPDQLKEEIENSKKGKGSSFKGKMVKQSDLPEGKTVFRIIPRPDHHLPWARVEEHNFYNKATKGWALFNCVASTGTHCEGCAMSQRLKDSDSKLDQEMGESGRAKAQFFMNVEFLLWGGEPVPKEMQGIKIFKFGLGIYKGSERGVTGGLLGLLEKYSFIQDPMKGCAVAITKLIGNQPLDTKYLVDIEKTRVEDEDGVSEKITKTPLPSLKDTSEAGLEAFVKTLQDLGSLARLEARNEIMDKLAKFMSPEVRADRRLGTGQSESPATGARKFQRATDILDGEGEEVFGPGTDDIPFDATL